MKHWPKGLKERQQRVGCKSRRGFEVNVLPL